MTLVERIQKLKAKKGFTLVELIVVIAILAVLMAILVPTMMGFVEDSRIKSADAAAKQYYDLVKTFVSREEANGRGLKKTVKADLTITVSNNDGKAAVITIKPDKLEDTDFEGTGKVADFSKNLKTYLEEQLPNAKNGSAAYVMIEDGAVVQSYYSDTAHAVTSELVFDDDGKNSDGVIVGSSPKVNASKSESSSENSSENSSK